MQIHWILCVEYVYTAYEAYGITLHFCKQPVIYAPRAAFRNGVNGEIIIINVMTCIPARRGEGLVGEWVENCEYNRGIEWNKDKGFG